MATLMEWITWGAKEAGTGAVKSIGAAPISFAVNYGLTAWLGNAETDALAEVQQQLKGITEQLDKGFKQIDARLDALEQTFGEGLREVLLDVQEEIVNQYIIDLDNWFEQMRTGVDWDEVKKPEKRQDVEETVNKVCQNMRDSLLHKQVGLLTGRYRSTGAKPESAQLLADAIGLEAWVDRVLLEVLKGVVVVEESFRQQGASQVGREWHQGMWERGLKPLFDEYLLAVESLVLGYLNCLAVKPTLPHAEPWRDVMGAVHYIFKRCDLFVLGFAYPFTQGKLPANLLCGRAVGPKEVLDRAEARVVELQKLAAPAAGSAMAPFPGVERVTHAEAYPVLLPGLKLDAGKLVPAPRESAHMAVLRYRLAGLPESLASTDDKDGVAAPAAGSPEATLRGEPAIESLGYPAIWDGGFSPLEDTWGASAGQKAAEVVSGGAGTSEGEPQLTCKAETVLALPMIQTYHSAPATTDAPFCYATRYRASWQAQLAGASPFWEDGLGIEETRRLAFHVSSAEESTLPVWWRPDHAIEDQYARLLLFDGVHAKEAEIQVALAVGAQVKLAGYDTDYHLKIDLVKTKDASRGGLEAVPLLAEIMGKHLPYRDKWRGAAYSYPCNYGQSSLKIGPGDYVWLRASASLWWPRPGGDSTFFHAGKDEISGEIVYRILDLQLLWK